jgi:hypothetical protein
MGRASRQAHLLPQWREDSHSCARAAGVILPARQVRSPGSTARAGAATSREGAGPRLSVAAARLHGRQDACRAPAHFIEFHRRFCEQRRAPAGNGLGECRSHRTAVHRGCLTRTKVRACFTSLTQLSSDVPWRRGFVRLISPGTGLSQLMRSSFSDRRRRNCLARCRS